MQSTRPYLLRAFYQWIADNGCTPYIVFDVEKYDINIPERFIEGSQIVLNISMSAVKDLEMANDFISFHAKFGGVSYYVSAPMRAVVAIYAEENGRGMVFSDEDMPQDDDTAPAPTGAKGSKKSHLTVIK